MPNDSLASIPASSVSAFGGIIRDMLGASLPQLALVLLAIIIIVVLRKNSKITLFNSSQNKETRIALQAFSRSLIALEAKLKAYESSYSDALDKTERSIRFEIDKIHGIVMALQDGMGQKLDMIPKVQDALKAYQERLDTLTDKQGKQHETISKITVILTDLKKRQGGGPV